jgi:hypothetical protein
MSPEPEWKTQEFFRTGLLLVMTKTDRFNLQLAWRLLEFLTVASRELNQAQMVHLVERLRRIADVTEQRYLR